MTETFTILPAQKRRMWIHLVVALAAGAFFVWAANDGYGWFFWVLGGVGLGYGLYTLVALIRRRYVVRVDDRGVTVCVATGKEVSAAWDKIESHAINPEGRVGAIMARSKDGAKVRILPVSTGLIGAEAAERLIAAMKERLPNLEYRIPQMGAAKKK